MTGIKLALLAALTAVGVAVLGSTAKVDITGRSPLSSQAAEDVRQRAENAAVVMSRDTRSLSPAERARAVVGGEPDRRIELMAAGGDTGRGWVVLRISSAFSDDGPWNNTSAASACFRYAINGRTGMSGPDEVDCPDGPPLALPAPPFDPAHPQDAHARLAAALAAPAPEDAVAAAFDLPGLTLQTATVDGVVAAAVQASPGECVSGRRLPDGTVEVWSVPRIVAMPGEIGCSAAAAADASSARSPH